MRLKLILLFLTFSAVYAQAQDPGIMVQSGHTNRINAGSISSDDMLLATGGTDAVIRIWNLRSGKLLKQYTNKDDIYCLAFLPESTSLLSGCYGIESEAAKIWDLQQGTYLSMDMYGGSISAATSKAGTYMALGNSRGRIAFYNMADGGDGMWYYETGKEETIKSLAFSDDETLLAAGESGIGEERNVYLWSTSNKELISSYAFEGAVIKVHFISNTELLVEEQTWTQLNKLFRLDLETGKKEKVLDISSFVVINDNKEVIGMTADHTLGKFDIASGRKISEITIREKFIDEVVISSNEEFIVALGRDIECLYVDSGNSNFYIPGVSWIEGMSFSSKGNKLAFTAESGHITSWDMESGEVEILYGHKRQARDLFYDAEGTYLASVGDDSLAIIWNKDGTIKHRIPFHSAEFNTVSMNPSADLLAVSVSDSILIYDVETGEFLAGYSFGEVEAQKVVYSPNNRDMGYLISNYLLVYDVVDGRYRLEEQIGTASLEDISFSGDGRYVAASGYTDSLYVYDLDSNELAFAAKLPDGVYVNSLSFDPTSLILAAGFSNGNVRIYDVSVGSILADFEEFGNLVNKLSFREDGKVLAGSSWDGKLVLWDMEEYQKLAELYAFEDGTWAIIDPDGRYDASNAGNIEHIHFSVGTETISLDQLKERFYEPGLLQKLLGYREEPLRDVSRLTTVQLYPETDMRLEGDALELRFRLREGGLGRVQFFINGKEIAGDIRSFLTSDTLNNYYAGRIDLNDYSNYFLYNRPNELSLIAYNEAGYLASPRVSVDYTPLEKADKGNAFTQAMKPRLYGIVIGTSNYRGENLDLQFADKDARDFSSALRQTANALFGEGYVDIRTFVTEDESQIPQKTNIEEAFKSLKTKAHPMDVLVVYMSGHGTTYTSEGSSQFHYLTMDVGSGDISDKAIRESYTISTEELTSWINAIPVEKQVLILDACSSGQAIEDIMVSKKSVTSGQIRALERLKDRTGMFVLTGSASDKVSFEASRFGQSLLTYSLLSGIKGQALREGEFVDVLNLFEHAAESVPELAKHIGGIQKPILAIPYGGQSFDIGRLDGSVNIDLASIKPVFIRSNFQDEFEFDDVLRLSEKIDMQFRDMSVRSKSAEIIFVDVNKYPEAYSIKGRYNQSGDVVSVQARVFKDREVIGEFTLEGNAGNLDDLVESVIDKARLAIAEE